ncbi:MAG: hypothetical protein J5750_03125 [Clostridiales bacterium]|nr:hypothetical protein [Clostridiales bacterium]
MNYYGTEEYKKEMEVLEEQIFSKIRFTEPDRVRELEDGYRVEYYYYADEEHRLPGHAPVDGEICRLFRNEEQIYEWKNTDGNSRMADIIHHANGKTYLVFDEDLYGYSVLDLTTRCCMHYIPEESKRKTIEEMVETFIWCRCFYDPKTNQMAVDGCYWASPDSLIVLDFSDPMKTVETENWIDIYRIVRDTWKDAEEDDIGVDIEFLKREDGDLLCRICGGKTKTVRIDLAKRSAVASVNESI